MKDYKYDGGFGKHKIRVDFQCDDYTGHLIYTVGGNSHGYSLLEGVNDSITWVKKFEENTCHFKTYEEYEWFTMTLTSDEGDELIIEEELDDVGDYIVGVSIVEYKKD